MKNLENQQDQQDQQDQTHGITTTIQALSRMKIKPNDSEEHLQGEQTDQNGSSDDSSSSYRASEIMCTRPGTPENLSTEGNCIQEFHLVANIL